MYNLIKIILITIAIGQEPFTLLDLQKAITNKNMMIDSFNQKPLLEKINTIDRKTWLEESKLIMGKYAQIRSELKLDIGEKYMK